MHLDRARRRPGSQDLQDPSSASLRSDRLGSYVSKHYLINPQKHDL